MEQCVTAGLETHSNLGLARVTVIDPDQESGDERGHRLWLERHLGITTFSWGKPNYNA